MDRFRDIIAERHKYAREWKAAGQGNVVGWLCTYVPEEIIYAAGMLPVRILGSHEIQDVSDAYISTIYCPFCRDALAQGLKGRYSYLDGLVHARSCVHIRNTYVNWKNHVPVDFTYLMFMPAHIQSLRATEFLAREYRDFREALETFGGKTISEADLSGAIEVYNLNRRLTTRVYELRKEENPPITGAEAMEVVIAGQLMDKGEHNRLLEQLLRELPEHGLDRDPGPRLMLVGSEMDDINFVRMVEELGATFVVDEHCSGTRYFWEEAVNTGDPLSALAARYIHRPACPPKDWPERRRPRFILSLAREYNVQGVILFQQKFCDPHEFEIPALQQVLKENGVPTLFLEFDVTVPWGQFRTRIEAFLEMLAIEAL
ncbi:MAG: 2-hydroxyacyl-CoA dehydratase [Dehalococcoidia bacterium]|nr:2-hydroxyacyl-CoA dehydratase [Dehalococcoidia bacterium]